MSDENNKTNLPTLGVREDLYKKSYLKRYETQQDILDKLVQKQAQNSPGFTLSSKKEDGKYVFHRDYSQNDLTDDQKKLVRNITWFSATGSSNGFYASMLIDQTIKAFLTGHESRESGDTNFDEITNAVYGALVALNPQDEIEGQLCSRLIVLHNQYMQYLAIAVRLAFSENATPEICDYYNNRAIKLMRAHTEALDALQKYRRKGEQKVVVQHVHVNDGGQAVVAGQVNPGGGQEKK